MPNRNKIRAPEEEPPAVVVLNEFRIDGYELALTQERRTQRVKEGSFGIHRFGHSNAFVIRAIQLSSKIHKIASIYIGHI